MTTRIGLVSDVHSTPDALREALQRLQDAGVDEILCAGDIAGYYDTVVPTVELLIASGCHAIQGNHDQQFLATPAQAGEEKIRDWLAALPPTLAFEREGLSLLAVHAEPPAAQTGGLRLLDTDGKPRAERLEEWRSRLGDFEHDVLIVGHTHQVYALDIGDTFVVNPGSTVFNHSCMILTLPDLEVEMLALGGREIVKCWNFGMLASQPRSQQQPGA